MLPRQGLHELGSAGRRRTVSQLVNRLTERTSSDRLSLLSHLSIGRTLCKLQDAILAGEEVSKKAAEGLLGPRQQLGPKEEGVFMPFQVEGIWMKVLGPTT